MPLLLSGAAAAAADGHQSKNALSCPVHKSGCYVAYELCCQPYGASAMHANTCLISMAAPLSCRKGVVVIFDCEVQLSG